MTQVSADRTVLLQRGELWTQAQIESKHNHWLFEETEIRTFDSLVFLAYRNEYVFGGKDIKNIKCGGHEAASSVSAVES